MIPFPTLSSEFVPLDSTSQSDVSGQPKEAHRAVLSTKHSLNTKTDSPSRAQALIERVLTLLPALAKTRASVKPVSTEPYRATGPMPINYHSTQSYRSTEPMPIDHTHSTIKTHSSPSL